MSYIYIIIQVVFIVLIGITGSILPDNLFILTGVIIGVFTMTWAVWTMKLSNLSMIPDLKNNSVFVTHGPYKLIRHPMYSSVLLVTLMLVINHLTLWRVGFWMVLFTDLHFKSLYEEELLLTKYSEYSDYKSNTKRLIPFIY
jgi:protein-S-isoprenylcysteine O-methyltransferase Ste14